MKNNFNSHRNSFGKNYPSSLSKGRLLKAIHEARHLNKYQNTIQNPEYIPKHKFEDFQISDQLKIAIQKKNYTLPTPIQDLAIPEILAGKDVTGIANTGTGKTAAFLIPLIEKVSKNKSEKILIITPTRELASQINQELNSFTTSSGIYGALCVGGMSIGRQKFDLRRNPNFVIGTPGRIKYFIRQRILNLQQYHTVVLDEVDRMVDIGFINDIKYFISLLPELRQSLFFSATISSKVNEILQSFIHNPVTISVKQQESSERIYQDTITVINRYKKIDQLQDLLIKDDFVKVMVFGRTKWGIQKLADELHLRGFRVGAIHGNKNQNQRQRTLAQFKNNEISILLATDVASRGLDIPDVSHVINYDMPATLDDYIHRIGRTGRANKNGVALTFID